MTFFPALQVVWHPCAKGAFYHLMSQSATPGGLLVSESIATSSGFAPTQPQGAHN